MKMVLWIVVTSLLLHALQALHTTESGDVRLVGGTRHCTGVVEMKHQTEWRRVVGFDHSWYHHLSPVMCRQLSCGSDVSTRRRRASKYQPVWWFKHSCVGAESALADCRGAVVSETSSWSLELICSDSAVTCNLTAVPGTKYETVSSTFSPGDTVTVTCERGYLIGSSRDDTGLILCKVDGQWESPAVCEEITCGQPHEPGLDWSDYTGGERLDDTFHYRCKAGYKPASSTATCTEDGWTPQLLCEEIKCDKPNIPNAEIDNPPKVEYTFHEKVSYRCLDGVTHQAACTRDGWSEIKSCKAVQVQPTVDTTEYGDVRLVGGTSNCTGTLEVKHQGEWRPATDFTSDLTLYSSSVVCRQLGCGSAVDTKQSSGSVRKPVWVITSSCNGSEASLKDCVTMQSGRSVERLEVICSALFSQCGRAQPPDVKKVHGGRGSVAGTHPWQVSLRRRTKGSSEPFKHHCGGVLIASCWVLTAAHCINSSKEMQVVLGGVYLIKKEAFDQIIPVVRAIDHPDYRDIKYPDGSLYTLRNDVALLELNVTKGPLCAMETRYVKTACLPNQLFPDGKECVITGWGRNKEGDKKRTNRLMEGKVPLVSKQNCTAPHVYEDRLDNTMICAGHMEGGVDACQGDSGGPLMCEQDGIHYIAGLVSWGPQCVLNDKPGVYANVHRYVDWIHEKMTNDIDYTYDEYDDYD